MYTDTICICIYTHIYFLSVVHIFFNIGRMCLVAPKQLNTNIIRGFVKRAQFCETCATSVKRAQLLGNVSETCTYRKHWVGAVKHVIPIYMYIYIFSIFICIYIYMYINMIYVYTRQVSWIDPVLVHATVIPCREWPSGQDQACWRWPLRRILWGFVRIWHHLAHAHSQTPCLLGL